MSLLGPSSPCYNTSSYLSTTTMESKVFVRPQLFTSLMLCISNVFAVLRKSQAHDSNGSDSFQNKVRNQSGDSGFYSAGSGLSSPPNSLSRENAKSPTPKTDRNSNGPRSPPATTKIDATTIKRIVNDNKNKAQAIQKLTNDLEIKEKENTMFRNLIGNIKAFIQEMGEGVITEQLAEDLDTAVTEKHKANASYRNLVTVFNEVKNELTAYKRTFGDEVKNSAEFQDFSSEVSRDQKLEHILKDIQEILQAMAEDKRKGNNEFEAELAEHRRRIAELQSLLEQLSKKLILKEEQILDLQKTNSEYINSLKRKETENNSFRDTIINKTKDLQDLHQKYGEQSEKMKQCNSEVKKLTVLNSKLLGTIDTKNEELKDSKTELERALKEISSAKFASKLATAGDIYSHAPSKSSIYASEYVRPEHMGKKNEMSSDFDMLPLSEFTHADNVEINNKHYRGSKKAGRTESDASEIRLQMFKCENCFKVIDDESKYLKHKYICLSD